MKMFSQQRLAVLFLDTTKFDLYLPNGSVVSYNLPPTLVRDLEVLEKDTLSLQITGFIDVNKIAPMTIIFVLSERILFSRDFANTADLQEQVTIVQDFLDSIPFDNLITKTYKLDKGFRVVAANRDFYENIKNTFETKGFIIEAVAPITVIGPELATLTLLNRELAQKIISKINTIRQNALEIHYESSYPQKNAPQDTTKRTYKIRLYAMIGTFAVLLIVMSFLAYQTFKPEPVKILPPQPTVSSTQPIRLTASPTQASTPILKKTLQLVITNSAHPSTDSATLQTNLIQAGYDNTTISTQSSSPTTRTRIIFKPSVPSALQEEILGVVGSLFANPTITEQDTNLEDISIYLP